MPFDGSGNFQRTFPPNGWVGDAQSLIKIKSDRHDQHDNDLAAGLTNCITKDGQSQPTSDIPMNGHRIVNMADPVNDADAATKKYVGAITGWATSKTISGADLNGRLIFSGTGATGLQWTAADISWVARIGEAGKTSSRLVLNDKADATGNDSFTIDDGGRVNSQGAYSNNLSHDGTVWRTITAGIGTLWQVGTGVLTALANDVATTANYQSVVSTLREFFKVYNVNGDVTLQLNKSASGKVAGLRGTMANNLRWLLYLGDQTVESATDRVGSDFYIYSYNNAGAVPFAEFNINRQTHVAQFGGEMRAGVVTTSQVFDSLSTVCILAAAAGGTIKLRPDGPAVVTSSVLITTNGGIQIAEGDPTPADGIKAGWGVQGKTGQTGAYSAFWMNSLWNGSSLTMYANNATLGQVAWTCDYRIKKDIQPLPSTWEQVKALNPISYTQRAYEVWTEDDTVRWGFLAHELQESLSMAAASGVRDGPEVQSPNLLVIIAGLTRALQEAMLRIEALEAGS